MATTPLRMVDGPIAAALGIAAGIQDNLNRVIHGKPDVARLVTAAVMGGGHVLLEDLPGVGKTLMAKALARSVGGRFQRIQATADLLPADLTGVSVYNAAESTWQFRPGPLFANIVVVDEINRATPRTQSALLEAMEERQVTVDGRTRALPSPFCVIGTQNPQEHHGTFPLVEGQRDRFMMILHLGLPDRESERAILQGEAGVPHLGEITPVAPMEVIEAAIQSIGDVHVADPVIDYILDIVAATRDHESVEVGASPRAALGVKRASQAHAVCDGRTFVTPTDVKRVAQAALAHRIVATGSGGIDRTSSIVGEILRQVPPPQG